MVGFGSRNLEGFDVEAVESVAGAEGAGDSIVVRLGS